MVKVSFRLSGTSAVPLSVDVPRRLDEVVHQCAIQAGVELGGYIAVRKGRVVTGETMVSGEDEIDVFPAISGG
ncbi:MoaD/ThiS family protein [Desulfopila aestuarii]|uniref:ThiS family protein n=1 Tax=Desulfopila aestuarii DSM 18488 TaxID=1121416 RepID=A0A1M7YBL0_9BACT|nr:MoaD/ThiS family protein [Desulfopila aestuarii]SHO50005.1 ThiS family protein [Desulfopila aestuarii DSM 18488]